MLKNDVSTSTSTSSTTTKACPIIEKCVLSVSDNEYHVSKSQHDIREQRNFIARMRYRARKKASKQPVAKKPKLTRAQEEQKKAKLAQAKYNMNTPAKKIHI